MKIAEEMLGGLRRPIIGIHAGYGPSGKKAGQVNRLRGWSCENFGRVAEGLAKRGASIVLTGSQRDAAACESIARFVKSGPVRMLAGKTNVAQLGGVIKSFDLLISVDSAPPHMAAALGTPAVVLWGPGIFAQTRPYSATTPISILQSGVPCAPCYGTDLMKTCTRNICMEFITPDQVVESATALLHPASTLLQL